MPFVGCTVTSATRHQKIVPVIFFIWVLAFGYDVLQLEVIVKDLAVTAKAAKVTLQYGHSQTIRFVEKFYSAPLTIALSNVPFF